MIVQFAGMLTTPADCRFVHLLIAHFWDFWSLVINRSTADRSTDLPLQGHASGREKVTYTCNASKTTMARRFLCQREGQTAHYERRKVLHCAAGTLAAHGLKDLFSAVLERFLQPTLCRCSAHIWFVTHKNNSNFLWIFLMNPNCLLAHRKGSTICTTNETVCIQIVYYFYMCFLYP